MHEAYVDHSLPKEAAEKICAAAAYSCQACMAAIHLFRPSGKNLTSCKPSTGLHDGSDGTDFAHTAVLQQNVLME